MFETDCQSPSCCDLPSTRWAGTGPQTVTWAVKMFGDMSLCCHFSLRSPNASFPVPHCVLMSLWEMDEKTDLFFFLQKMLNLSCQNSKDCTGGDVIKCYQC